VVTATSIVRGPETDFQWRFAVETPGLCRYFNRCWQCHEEVTPEDIYCPECRSDMRFQVSVPSAAAAALRGTPQQAAAQPPSQQPTSASQAAGAADSPGQSAPAKPSAASGSSTQASAEAVGAADQQGAGGEAQADGPAPAADSGRAVEQAPTPPSMPVGQHATSFDRSTLNELTAALEGGKSAAYAQQPEPQRRLLGIPVFWWLALMLAMAIAAIVAVTKWRERTVTERQNTARTTAVAPRESGETAAAPGDGPATRPAPRRRTRGPGGNP